jgi:hypothetical protein
MLNVDRLTRLLPISMRRKVDTLLDLINMSKEVNNSRVVLGLLPSVGRGLVLQQGRNQPSADMISGHAAHFTWDYRTDFPEMRDLYRRAKENQWNADEVLDWSTDVDPMNPEVPLLDPRFFDIDGLSVYGVRLGEKERQRFLYSIMSWVLSQFLHGEQGALLAAAQVTESVHWMDGKLYGATQVMDEGRHVEVFDRYLETKLNKLYTINDNLFVIIDALTTDSRWDMKFLGMQIMIEGLALGAFGTIFRLTSEPLLKEMLRYVIQDEARHVHFGVLALREHIAKGLSEKERVERADWAFEVALLMRNRFLMHEVYEEWFEGMMTRRQWDEAVNSTPGMIEFRRVMFSRLIPNLRYIGLMPERMHRHYAAAGLMDYYDGADASQLDHDKMMNDLENQSLESVL